MPNTYTQSPVRFVFAVKYRQATIDTSWRAELHRYLTGIVQNNPHRLLAIHSVAGHLHLFIGLGPNQSISGLLWLVKGNPTAFIDKRGFTNRKLYWQEGYGAFSNSHSQIDAVVKHMLNQEKHHPKKTVRAECLKMLNDDAVDYGERYVLHDLPEDETG